MYCGNCQSDIADGSNFCYVCGARQAVPAYVPVGPPRRLTRSVTDSKLGGVCGGLAEYWGVDSTIVRLIWVLAVIFTIPLAIVAYFVAWIVMPRADVYIPASVSAPPAQVVTSAPSHGVNAPLG
jgi:phage shock protein C